MQQTSDAEYVKQYVEAQKVIFDYIKHITTLDTGAIVLLTALLEKFFKTPEWKILITLTFSGFILSIIALTLTAFGIIRSIRTPLKVSTNLVRFTAWNFMIGIISFVIAIICLARAC